MLSDDENGIIRPISIFAVWVDRTLPSHKAVARLCAATSKTNKPALSVDRNEKRTKKKRVNNDNSTPCVWTFGARDIKNSPPRDPHAS